MSMRRLLVSTLIASAIGLVSVAHSQSAVQAATDVTSDKMEARPQVRTTPSPGTEAALRLTLKDFESGKPTLITMTPGLAAAAVPQLPHLWRRSNLLGGCDPLPSQM